MDEYPGGNNQNFSNVTPPKKTYGLAISLSIGALLLLVGAGFFVYQFISPEGGPPQDEQVTTTPETVVSTPPTPSQSAPATTGLYVVGVAENVSLEAVAQAVGALGVEVKYQLPLSHALVVTLNPNNQTNIEQISGVLWVEESVVLIPANNFSLLAALSVTPVPSGSTGGVDVFIIDSGSGISIPYASTYGPIYSSDQVIFSKDTNGNDMHGHGTIVATAFVETFNSLETTNEPVRLHSIKVTESTTNSPNDFEIAEAIRVATNAGAEVINLSYGVRRQSTIVDSSIQNAIDSGVVITVAAGNEADTKINYLTLNSQVIGVGALTPEGAVHSESSGFKEGSYADVFALGEVRIGDGVYQGTSISSPRTAAIAAHIMASPVISTYDKNGDGVWNIDEVEARLQAGIANREYTLVRSNEGVDALLEPLPTQTQVAVNVNTESQSTNEPEESLTVAVATDTLDNPEQQAMYDCVRNIPANVTGAEKEAAINFCFTETGYSPYLNKSPSQPSSLNSQGPEYYGPGASEVVAQPTTDARTASAPVGGGGLVPCSGLDCDLCSLGQLMQNIINFLLYFAFFVAAISIAVAAFLYISGGLAGDKGRITAAHKSFRDIIIGFLIAASAWLVVQTIISVVFDQTIFIGGNWNQLQCSQEDRLMNTNLSDLINLVVPVPQASLVREVAVCEAGLTFIDGECVDPSGRSYGPPSSYVRPKISSGSCAPNVGAFGGRADQMSCICGAESAGVANVASRTDVMKANGQAFSWGLYQINLTANEIRCPNQPVLDCPKAFAGKNYSATINNKALYDRCVAAAQNVQCNTATAQYLLNNTPNSITNWSTYGQCVGN